MLVYLVQYCSSSTACRDIGRCQLEKGIVDTLRKGCVTRRTGDTRKCHGRSVQTANLERSGTYRARYSQWNTHTYMYMCVCVYIQYNCILLHYTLLAFDAVMLCQHYTINYRLYPIVSTVGQIKCMCEPGALSFPLVPVYSLLLQCMCCNNVPSF